MPSGTFAKCFVLLRPAHEVHALLRVHREAELLLQRDGRLVVGPHLSPGHKAAIELLVDLCRLKSGCPPAATQLGEDLQHANGALGVLADEGAETSRLKASQHKPARENVFQLAGCQVLWMRVV